ncbi:MAG: TetR/AcrR family transcriptional regulator C-terminal domain-containing protein [Erysipelotrichales bacterium]|nr:TetR/AcrR family transcriptional regulator C-terminal domain-containing protein [Erysipelotrichales bacterium]
MKTEQELANALKELMSRESLDDITVKRLTDICNIKRQTFYYHFRDIYDLLTWIFLNEDLNKNNSVDKWQDAVRVIAKYTTKNKRFVQNTLSSAGKELFEQFISSYLYAVTLTIFAKYDKKGVVPNEDKRMFVSYYVSGISSAIIIWIEKGMKENENQLIKHLELVVGDFVQGLILKYTK